MGIELVELSNLIEYQKEFITINDEEEYKRCTAKLNRQGIVLRDVIKGKDIKTKKQQVCKAGQLLVAEIDAKVGGYGIVPPELEGAIVSSHYFLFNVNEEKLNRLYLHYYLKTDDFFNQIKPQGTTNYASIRPKDVLKIKIPLPSLERQKEIVEKLERFFKNKELFDKQNKNNAEILNKLRQSILQEAVQGKLVPQDPNDESASVLIEKIKEEKERLIKEGKIKKEKPLPPISEDEIPYELPEGWEWIRLGNLIEFLGGYAFKSGTYIEKSDNQVIRLGNVKNDKLLLDVSPVFIPDEIANENEKYQLIENDILVTMTGTRGKRDYFYTCLINKEHIRYRKLYLNQRVGCLRIFSKINHKLVNLFLKSDVILNAIFETETGTANQGNIGAASISNLLFPLPPLNEQKRIVEKVDQLMALCDELERNIEQSKKDSELLMQSILQEAFKEA